MDTQKFEWCDGGRVISHDTGIPMRSGDDFCDGLRIIREYVSEGEILRDVNTGHIYVCTSDQEARVNKVKARVLWVVDNMVVCNGPIVELPRDDVEIRTYFVLYGKD